MFKFYILMDYNQKKNLQGKLSLKKMYWSVNPIWERRMIFNVWCGVF